MDEHAAEQKAQELERFYEQQDQQLESHLGKLKSLLSTWIGQDVTKALLYIDCLFVFMDAEDGRHEDFERVKSTIAEDADVKAVATTLLRMIESSTTPRAFRSKVFDVIKPLHLSAQHKRNRINAAGFVQRMSARKPLVSGGNAYETLEVSASNRKARQRGDVRVKKQLKRDLTHGSFNTAGVETVLTTAKRATSGDSDTTMGGASYDGDDFKNIKGFGGVYTGNSLAARTLPITGASQARQIKQEPQQDKEAQAHLLVTSAHGWPPSDLSSDRVTYYLHREPYCTTTT